ncbi:MAG: PLP-dependent aminotransferase family protein [Anaerolineales bacterium]|nr:PLP-dependent aminotransferase family protein [Anaerolineales bacterium]MCB9004629.1 PLP-dependent aminotransferase family protein [Ardenticatenaceae bacterium]
MLNPSHELKLADWTQTMSRSVLRQMIAVVSRPGILSFAGGLPDPDLFPRAEFAAAMAQVLTQDKLSLQYRPPLPALKQHIVQLMAQRGVTCTAEQIFLTTGAQQGLDVLARLLLNPGGEVLLEEVVYPGVQQVVASARPRILSVPTDLRTGIDVDAVEAHLQNGARPAFIYAITEAHNPLGVSISVDKRQKLVELAQHYGAPIIEDDPYGFLLYDGEMAARNGTAQSIASPASALPLRALDDEWVFYLGSFSKIIAPALRLGWMVAPEPLIAKLTVVKEAEDLESSALTQRAVAAYLEAGYLPGHLQMLRVEYGRRRDMMLAALKQHFPSGARWTHPKGGMFIWVELPPHYNTTDLLPIAVEEEQVAFIPGYAFAVPGHTVTNCMRLNFSNSTPARIEEGIARLGRLLQRYA